MFRIKQLLVDLYQCDADLNDADNLMRILEKAAKIAGSTVVDRYIHRFQPVGVTVFLILAETHLSIHTWPEHKYASLDIFICGKEKNPEDAWESIKADLRPQSYKIKEHIRTISKINELRRT